MTKSTKDRSIGDLQDRERAVAAEILVLVRQLEADFNIEVSEVRIVQGRTVGARLHQAVGCLLELKI